MNPFLLSSSWGQNDTSRVEQCLRKKDKETHRQERRQRGDLFFFLGAGSPAGVRAQQERGARENAGSRFLNARLDAFFTFCGVASGWWMLPRLRSCRTAALAPRPSPKPTSPRLERCSFCGSALSPSAALASGKGKERETVSATPQLRCCSSQTDRSRDQTKFRSRPAYEPPFVHRRCRHILTISS